MKNIKTFLFAFLCAFFFQTAFAHDDNKAPTQVTLQSSITGNDSRAYSPTIASNPSGTVLVAGYAFTPVSPNDDHREVGISLSTDGGSNWAPAAISKPKWQGTTTLENVDDPQIAFISGNFTTGGTFVCVVRAWAKDNGKNGPSTYDPNASTMEGQDCLELEHQNGSIYKKCGIYYCFSTDGGQTWGYYVSGTWTQNTWGKVDETTFPNDGISTLENPRIAYRSDYVANGRVSDIGYIVWEKKFWKRTGTSAPYNYAVDKPATKLGIAAFGLNLINYSTSGSPANYLAFGSPNIGPERPSVAVAPDNSIWVSFYTLSYPSSASTVHPALKVFLAKGYSTLSGGTITYTFNTSGVEFNATVTKTAVGNYDFKRGYVYAGNIDDEDPTTGDFCVDLTQGPSIQTVSNYKSTSPCDYHYWVGVAYPYGYTNSSLPAYPNENYTKVSFNSLTASFSRTLIDASDISWLMNNRDVQNDCINVEHSANMQFFPVLKYVTEATYLNIDQDFERVEAQDLDNNSFFCIAYMAAERKHTLSEVNPSIYNPKCFKYGACITGISVDNTTFFITKYPTSLNQTRPLAVGAEPYNTDELLAGWVNPRNGFWGSKIDIAGGIDYFEAHPIWHHIIPDMMNEATESTSEVVRTNIAHGTLAKAWLTGFPANESITFPTGSLTGTGIFKEISDNPPHTDATYYWGDYAYFDFNDLGAPTSLTANPSITISPYEAFNPGPFGPVLYGATYLYGIFFQAYDGSNSVSGSFNGETGTLGFSNQRKFVTSGSNLHSVYERGTDVFYNSYVDGDNSYGFFGTDYYSNLFRFSLYQLQSWGQEIKLNSSSTTGVRPAIGVYQSGDGSGGIGEKVAIAMTWVEYASGVVSIKMRTREFNKDFCGDAITEWSDVYTIHSHANPYAGSSNPNYDDGTTPVIAPFVTTSGSFNPTTSSSILLGWNILWTSPRLTAGGIMCNPLLTGIYSRMWLRVNDVGVLTDNSNWGVFSPLNIYNGNSPTSPMYISSGTGVGFQPKGTASGATYNVLFENSQCSDLRFGFPTMTSTENKFTLPPAATQADRNDFYDFDVAFSNIKSSQQFGVWTFNVEYLRSGTAIGSYNPTNRNNYTCNLPAKTQNPTVPFNISAPPLPLAGLYLFNWDRNPCITVNSSGQSFTAWEQLGQYLSIQTFFGPGMIVIPIPTLVNTSEIVEVHKPFNSCLWVNNGFIIQNVYMDQITTLTWDWLRNPSISGYPKSHLHDDRFIRVADLDPGAVDMLFWEENTLAANGKTLLNTLHSGRYSEAQIQPGTGKWVMGNSNTGTFTGANSQRSFGQYNAGPALTHPAPQVWPTTPLGDGDWAMGNAVDANGNILDPFVAQTYGSYKGTFDTIQSYRCYRGEKLFVDSEVVRFIWGNVLVGDTSSSLPMRQVILHWGIDSATCMDSLRDVRDSIFKTEVFDFPIGATMNYFRGMYLCDSLTLSSISAFYGSNKQLRYTFELVHDNGTIDTIERLVFSPYYGKFLEPARMQVTNGAGVERDVYLRVRTEVIVGAFQSRFSILEDISSLSELHFDYDTSFTTYKKGLPIIDHAGDLVLANPYPNPQTAQNGIVRIPYSFVEGYPVFFEVFDELGRVIVQKTETANGGWKDFSFPTPQNSGLYVIYASAGNSRKSVMLNVTK